MIQIRNNLVVPVEFLRHTFQNRSLNTLKVFIYFKFVSDGKITGLEGLYPSICEDLGVKSTKTLRKHLLRLEGNQLLSHNPKTDTTFIRGWTRAYQVYGLQSMLGVRMEYRHLETFRDFSFSAVVSLSDRRSGSGNEDEKRDVHAKVSLPPSILADTQI